MLIISKSSPIRYDLILIVYIDTIIYIDLNSSATCLIRVSLDRTLLMSDFLSLTIYISIICIASIVTISITGCISISSFFWGYFKDSIDIAIYIDQYWGVRGHTLRSAKTRENVQTIS